MYQRERWDARRAARVASVEPGLMPVAAEGSGTEPVLMPVAAEGSGTEPPASESGPAVSRRGRQPGSTSWAPSVMMIDRPLAEGAVSAELQLRPYQWVRLHNIPLDLSPDEVARLCRFIRACAVPVPSESSPVAADPPVGQTEGDGGVVMADRRGPDGLGGSE